MSEKSAKCTKGIEQNSSKGKKVKFPANLTTSKNVDATTPPDLLAKIFGNLDKGPHGGFAAASTCYRAYFKSLHTHPADGYASHTGLNATLRRKELGKSLGGTWDSSNLDGEAWEEYILESL